MVGLSSPKRQRRDSLTFIKNDSVSYPLSLVFSSLAYSQSSACLDCSSSGIIVAGAQRPRPPALTALAGDVFTTPTDTHRTFLRKTLVNVATEYHESSTITHLQWNQRGKVLASIDERGKLALWNVETSIYQWTPIYKTNLEQPVVAFQWFHCEREYAMLNDTMTRKPFQGPRNPFGQLAFLAILADGQIRVYFQRNRGIFSQLSTVLPTPYKAFDGFQETSCFGMALAGLASWDRISHASVTMDSAGTVYVATYSASHMQTQLYSVKVKFPSMSGQGALLCEQVTCLGQASIADAVYKTQGDMSVTHLLLSPYQDTIRLMLGFGRRDGGKQDEYSAYIGMWTLQHTVKQIPSGYFGSDGFGATTVTMNKTILQQTCGVSIPSRLVTALESTQAGIVLAGLSDGSVVMEQPSRYNENNHEWHHHPLALEDVFVAVSPSHAFADTHPDYVAGITVSPNDTHAICVYSSGRFGTARLLPTDRNDGNTLPDIHTVETRLQLSLMNCVDPLDLISELVRLDRQPETHDRVPGIILDAIHTFGRHRVRDPKNNQNSLPLDNWALAQLSQAYGFAMVVYQRLDKKHIEYTNLCKALQLPVVFECFLSSCTSDLTDINSVLETGSLDHRLTFDPAYLWSLVPLTTWMLEHTRWVVKEWFLLFGSVWSEGSARGNAFAQATPAILLVHSPLRLLLRKVLVMIHHYINFVVSGKYELTQSPERRLSLESYVSGILDREPVALQAVFDFIKALDQCLANTNQDDPWALLLSSRLPAHLIDPLRAVTEQCKQTCASSVLHVDPSTDGLVDVLCKTSLPMQPTSVRQCVWCHQRSTSTAKDANTLVPWYQSLKTRCICGGLFA